MLFVCQSRCWRGDRGEANLDQRPGAKTEFNSEEAEITLGRRSRPRSSLDFTNRYRGYTWPESGRARSCLLQNLKDSLYLRIWDRAAAWDARSFVLWLAEGRPLQKK